MDELQLHLIINHVPVLASLGGVALGLWGLLAKDRSLQHAAMAFFIVAAIGGLIATNTGEGAEHMVEDRAGISHDLIHAHEEAAERAFWIATVVGLMAAYAWYASRRALPNARTLLLLATISGLASFASMGYASALGGQIDHPELQVAAPDAEAEGQPE